MVSDDGLNTLTVIFFVGSVFSARYAAARALGPTSPLAHCALNVCLSGPSGSAWVMTEGLAPTGGPHILRLGASSLEVGPHGLRVLLAEPRTRFGGAHGAMLRGELTLEATVTDGVPVELAPGHEWTPVIPAGRARVKFEHPELRFEGDGYHDANFGLSPLESAFDEWQWIRTMTPAGPRVHYRGRRVDGQSFETALRWDAGGGRVALADTGWAPVRRGIWGLPRSVPKEFGPRPICGTLLDSPFYLRTLMEDEAGHRGVHESLSLVRFRRPWVRALLGFRTATASAP